MTPRYNKLIVGRQHELELIMDCYKAAKEGFASVVLMRGEPGIGKTRLLDTIANRAAEDGAVILQGGASGTEGMPPYQPFLEALGRYIQVTPLEQLREQITTIPQVLADLLPELVIRLGALPKAPPLPMEQARFRLYEAVGMFLEAIGASQALVLTLDDLHWADAASLDLICHIARRQSKARLLILGAYRESDINQNQAFGRTVAELSRQRVLTTIPVSPLSVKEIEELAINHLGCSFSPEVSLLLQQRSEGNPYFAEELLDDWVATGTIIREHDTFIALSPFEHPLPPNLVATLQQQFMRLSPDVIDCLRVAAIIGRKFNLSLLAAVQKQEIEAVEDRLLVAKSAHLVQVDPMGGFTFRHDNIRECLYAEVSNTRRKHLHGIIGDALEARYESEQTKSGYQLAELAFHYAHSSDQARAIDYAQRAASQALQTFAAEEAMSHYQTAVGLLGPNDKRYGDLLLALGETALLAGKEEQAEVAYKMAQQWLEQRGDDETAAAAAHGLGLAYWRQERRTEAYAALKHALELLGEHQCIKAVEISLDLSVLLTVFMSEQDEGTAYAQQAWEMARDLGDTRLETMAHRIVIGNLTIQSSELLSALPPLEQALELAENRGDLPEAGECCLYLACVYYWVAKIRRSYEVSERRIELIKQSHQLYQLRTAYPWHALLLASQGEWTEAEKMLELAYPVVDHLTSPLPFAFLHQIRGFLAYQREDYVVAERELQAAMIGQGQQTSLGEIPFYFGLRGLAQLAVERREEAYSYMVSLEKLLDTLPSGIPSTGPVLVCLALTALALHDEERTRHLYPRLLAFRGQFYWFLVDRVLGLLAILHGEWETAAIHLAEAEETARRESLKPELARILLGLANVESGRGGQGSSIRAKKLLNQAIESFEKLDMATSALNARSQLHSLAGRPPDSKPSPLSDVLVGLTEHEVEVLKLLVEGKNNREIAKELHLAQRTIENQLTEIFTKTNSKNRAAAAAFAVRHGLVYPADLTQQEVEVLKLLVEDKSNREIAKALDLAYKTVDDLLVTIFLKTNSRNRAEAKAFAIHHGLT